MATADRLQVVYRDPDRTPFLYLLRDVARTSQHIAVEVERVPDAGAYEEGFLDGRFDLICEHVRFLFAARRDGHPVRLLASCQNWLSDRLVARTDIRSLDDLRGSTLALRATESARITGRYWLKQLGLHEDVRVQIVTDADIGRWQQWRKIVAGEADVALCSPLYLDPPLAAGLHVLDVPRLPRIGSPFFAALGPFVQANDALLRRFFVAVQSTIDLFRTDPGRTIAVMSGEPARLMGLADEAIIRRRYVDLRDALDERPVPRLDALANSLAMLEDPTLADFNPLRLCDLRYVLELDEARLGPGTRMT